MRPPARTFRQAQLRVRGGKDDHGKPAQDTTARRGRRGPAGPDSHRTDPSREFIRLDEVAAELGCSVTPVREALVTLRGEGLVKSSPHRGFIVDELKRSDIVDIFWMQSQLSARLAVHAAANPDLPDCLADPTAIVDEFEGALAAGDGPADHGQRIPLPPGHPSGCRQQRSSPGSWSPRRGIPLAASTVRTANGAQAVESHRRLIGHLARGIPEGLPPKSTAVSSMLVND